MLVRGTRAAAAQAVGPVPSRHRCYDDLGLSSCHRASRTSTSSPASEMSEKFMTSSRVTSPSCWSARYAPRAKPFCIRCGRGDRWRASLGISRAALQRRLASRMRRQRRATCRRFSRMKPAFRAHPWHVCTPPRAPDPCPQQLDARALVRIPALAHVLRRTEFCSPSASLGDRLE